jgi:hypothetical protein
MIERVSIVLANYCPHCVPLSLRNAERIAEELGVPLQVLDIEIAEQETVADRLVEEHGDWSEDYLIPQVFIEYSDGRVTHLLTGFSEAVSVTEASWVALFSSSYYQTLLHKQVVMKRNPLKEVVDNYLSFKGRCRRHCDKSTSSVELWSDATNIVKAYVCPEGYVSRVIYFSRDPDIAWFKDFLSTQIGAGLVNDRDIRPATRHGWELSDNALRKISDISSTGVVKEVYWTTYPKSEKEKKRGIFLCSDPKKGKGCKNLFVQEVTSTEKLCSTCT